MPSVSDRVYMQYEGTYSYEKLKNTDTYVNRYNFRYVNDVKLVRNVINNSLMVRYEYMKKKFQPTLHA